MQSAQSPLTALLPRKIFPRKETVWFLPRQADRQVPTFPGTALLPRKLVPPCTTFLLGKVLPWQATTPQLRQAGRQAVRHSARLRAPRLPSGIVLLLRQVVLAPTKAPLPPIGSPKGLPQKNLTQSGSSTYPANL